ncbi:putative serine/threonine-protein kinase [Canna indica]|uniref:[RNA-polymerase]-subunit kinase n=1 Tax=Canna indica TaxID=4628 RepID=A0AAQ3K0U3_9LILI|nr:putative serine/threonine-protein kinase [Canna indica]
MGCAASTNAAPVTPVLNSSGVSGSLETLDEFVSSSSLWNRPQLANYEFGDRCESGESEKVCSSGNSSVSFRLWNLNRQVEAEQVAAGWPAWLSAAAGEAIQGWVPLKFESFDKLEKIGQGTYSTVFRACEIETGKIYALKKVRFDNFEPESVRFMAREIQILRMLDHPNIIKLEGLITSRYSCSIYLVFEYMEHDLSGLSSSPDIKLSEPQIKCYMKQLLSGLEQCHSRGIIHRDIKCANLLVNNEGILKIADFGLANIWNPLAKQPLTSRVVTLWYRPPELLLGSTDYEPSVDLWSVGCVFAELFQGKSILQGRTEVEQLHKIFKICGSPHEEFWNNSKLPHATVFKPQQPYENCLRETFEFLSDSALKLLETFLSVEPSKRGTASTALNSEYFRMKPYASDPSSLPKYQPNKEIDAKFREESRKSIINRSHVAEATRQPSRSGKPSRESIGLFKARLSKASSHREGSRNAQGINRSSIKQFSVVNDGMQPKQTLASRDEGRRAKQISQRDVPFSGPARVPPSSNFAWAKKSNEGQSHTRTHVRSRSQLDKSGKLDVHCISQAKTTFNLNGERTMDHGHAPYSNSKGQGSYESIRDAMLKQWIHPELQDSTYSFRNFHSRHPSDALDRQDTLPSKNKRLKFKGYPDNGEQVELSGPLVLQAQKVDEFLERHEQCIRVAVRKSWLQRGQMLGH